MKSIRVGDVLVYETASGRLFKEEDFILAQKAEQYDANPPAIPLLVNTDRGLWLRGGNAFNTNH